MGDNCDNKGVYKHRNAHFPIIDILKTEDYKPCCKKAEHYRIHSPFPEAVAEKNAQEYDTREGFDEHIAGGYFRTAGTAFAPQDKPAEHGNKVIPLNLRPAGHTVGIALDKGFALWQPQNTHI